MPVSRASAEIAGARRGRPRLQFRLRTVLLMVGYVGLLLSVFATWRATWRYEATAWLRIHASRPVPPFMLNPSVQAGEVLKRAMLAELLTSEAVMERAAERLQREGFRDFADAESKRDWVADHVHCRQVANSEILEVRYAGPDPQTAIQPVNAVVDAYLEVIADTAQERTDAFFERLCSGGAPADRAAFETRWRSDPFWVLGPGAVSVLERAGVPATRRSIANDTILRVGIPLWLLLGLVWLVWAGLGRRRRRRLASDEAFLPPVV